MTSLLDVLFCILFIVMLTSAQNEAELRASKDAETAELGRMIASKDAEIEELTETAEKYKNLAESLEIYKTDAVVASLHNEISGGRHVLVFTKENGESVSFPLGSDNMTNAVSRLESCIEPILAEIAGRPLYLVFNCDRDRIYTSEFYALNERLERYQSENKEIFYKITSNTY